MDDDQLHSSLSMGFFAKNVDARMDDPNAGWKDARSGQPMGPGQCTTSKADGESAESREDSVRPDPLAR